MIRKAISAALLLAVTTASSIAYAEPSEKELCRTRNPEDVTTAKRCAGYIAGAQGGGTPLAIIVGALLMGGGAAALAAGGGSSGSGNEGPSESP
jgi:hypothetical protein